MSYANVANNCTFIGRITKDIETETVGQGDKAFTKIRFNVAVEKKMTKDQKEKAKKENRPTADFIPCEAVGKQADNILKFFGKGKGIQIMASYESYSWDDKNGGGKRYGHRFNITDFGFPPGEGNGGSGNNGGGNNGSSNNTSNNPTPSNNNDTYPIDDSDIPF